MKLKNKILFCAFLFTYSYAASQHRFYVDSIRVYPLNPTTNDSIHVLVAGKFSDTGVRISNVVTTVSTDTFTLDFYETYCFGFTVIIPFDTTVNIGLLQAGSYFIRQRGIIDTNTVDTVNCYIVPDFIPVDSIGINITVLPMGIESREIPDGINIFPNPTKDQLTIDSKQFPINQIEIFNSLGEIIYSPAVHSRDREYIVHCASFPPGIYYVKATADTRIYFNKFIKIEGL